MRYVKINGYPIIFAYDKVDMKEGIGTPDELMDIIQREFRECAIGHTVKLTETDLKDCRNCENWIDGRCDYFVDPTDEIDDRFCTGFKWREY